MTAFDQFVVPRLRDYWRRLALRQAHYTSRADRLDLLYRIEDPWRMESAAEQARFAWTNRLIAAHFAPVGSLLEVGCGEGHQSQHLGEACPRLYGIDVSRRAVRRAEQRCPAAKFAVGDPFTPGFPEMQTPVDLVVACEVLYYIKDIPQFLTRLSELGRAWLVTYYQGQASTLAPYFTGFAKGDRETFGFNGLAWHAVWWRGIEK